MADADTSKPDAGTAPLRDPRMAWACLIAGFALISFGCLLIVTGDPAQRGYVVPVFVMGIVLLVTSGQLKIGDASVLIKAITGKG